MNIVLNDLKLKQ